MKTDIESLIKRGRLKRFVEDWKEPEKRDPKGKANAETFAQAASNIRVVHVIVGGPAARGGSSSQRKKYARSVNLVTDEKGKKSEPITFTDDDLEGVQTPHNNALVVSAVIGGVEVRRLLVNTGSSCDILYSFAFEKMGFGMSQLDPVQGR